MGDERFGQITVGVSLDKLTVDNKLVATENYVDTAIANAITTTLSTEV